MPGTVKHSGGVWSTVGTMTIGIVAVSMTARCLELNTLEDDLGVSVAKSIGSTLILALSLAARVLGLTALELALELILSYRDSNLALTTSLLLIISSLRLFILLFILFILLLMSENMDFINSIMASLLLLSSPDILV